MSVFASPETQKRSSNPYNFAVANSSGTKKKNKSSAKKAAKQAAAAAEQLQT